MKKPVTPNKKPVRWAPLAMIAAFMALAFAGGLHETISLSSIQENKEDLLRFVAEHPAGSAFAYVLVYISAVALSLPAASLLTLLGGFLFGKWLGTLYVVCAATAGATIIFLAARSAIGASLRDKAGGLYRRIEGNMRENAVSYLLFLRLVPLFPFFLVNIVPAMFNIPLRVYVLTTFFGIIPGSFVYVNLGRELGEITSRKDLVSGEVLLAFALLGLFALVPGLYKSFKSRRAAVTKGEKSE